jgi:hypothetical protein
MSAVPEKCERDQAANTHDRLADNTPLTWSQGESNPLHRACHARASPFGLGPEMVAGGGA